MLKAVIIDDEEKGRKLLKNLLDTYCDSVEVMAMADSVKTGAQLITKINPDLVFLDIVMPNEDGFVLLEQIPDFRGEVIFTTAYDQYAIRAIRACALDYLLKPIDVNELQAAVTRAQEVIANKSTGQAIDERIKTFIQNAKSG